MILNKMIVFNKQNIKQKQMMKILHKTFCSLHECFKWSGPLHRMQSCGYIAPCHLRFHMLMYFLKNNKSTSKSHWTPFIFVDRILFIAFGVLTKIIISSYVSNKLFLRRLHRIVFKQKFNNNTIHDNWMHWIYFICLLVKLKLQNI